jgi:hypothetical protein
MISTTPDANFYVGRNTKFAPGGISTCSVVLFFTSCGTFLHRVALFYIVWHFFTSGGTKEKGFILDKKSSGIDTFTSYVRSRFLHVRSSFYFGKIRPEYDLLVLFARSEI